MTTPTMQDEIRPELVPFARLLVSNTFQPYKYVVPEFQRPYSWEPEDVRYLLDDIDGAIRNDRPYYYLGAVVLAKDVDDTLKIIDGQQRLATSQIIVSRIWRFLREVDPANPNVATLASYFVHDHPRLGRRDTLELGPTDQPFFARHVINGEPVPSGSRFDVISHENISEAIKAVDEFIDDALTRLGNEALHKDYLLKFVDYLSRQVAVLIVLTSDERVGYQLFRSLNARGKGLTGVDLIKNVVYEKTRSDPQAIELWSQAVDPYDDPKTADVTDFLRAHWTARKGLVRLSELNDRYEPYVLDPAFDHISFLVQLGDDSEVYQAITQSAHTLWNSIASSQDKAPKRAVEIIVDHVVPRQVLPLLMVCVGKLKDDRTELTRLMQSFCGWAVRGVITKSWQKLPMETASANACASLRDRPAITTNDVYDAISHMIPSDTDFVEALRLKPLNNRQGKMLLGVIENYIRKYEQPDDDQQWAETDGLTLEHVLPQNPKHENWPQFCDEDDKLSESASVRVKLLGNMTLLSTSRNRDLSNSAYPVKKVRFNESSINVTKRICEEDEWDEAAIDRRHDTLLEYARLAFPSGVIGSP